MTELVRRDDVATLPQKMEWARAMAGSNLLPRQYQNNPGNLLFAVEYADALGVAPINAITSIHVIEGKPSASADLIASLIRRAGHKLRITGDDTYAEAHLIRADDPEFTYKARWDISKARAAGLLGKSVWKSYPGAMLRSRAITEVARMGASDALFGVIYTPEELGVETEADGTIVHTVTQVEPVGQRTAAADRVRDAIASAPPVAPTEDRAAAQADEDQGDGITSAQLKKMGAGMRDAGLTERQPALDFVASVIGRNVTTRNDLTKGEASRVIDALEAGLATSQTAAGGQPSGEVADSTPPTSPTSSEDVVDAELVDDAEAIWHRIVQEGEARGMSVADLQDDFPANMGGLTSDSADADELDAYLKILTTRPAA